LGFETILTHDGVDAILQTQRRLPRLLIMDSMLPKMYGFQVCELIKRNESLSSIYVILVGEVHDPARYHRAPDELYGADAYIEQPSLSDGLISFLRNFDLLEPLSTDPAPGVDRGKEPRRREQAVSTPNVSTGFPQGQGVRKNVVESSRRMDAVPVSTLPEEGPADDSFQSERANAERLARIVIADVVLYNEERFAEAIAKGNVVEAMEPEMVEGRNLFNARIEPRVRAERDFLKEELLRVAGQRR